MEMAKFENRFLTPIQGFTQSKIEKAKKILFDVGAHYNHRDVGGNTILHYLSSYDYSDRQFFIHPNDNTFGEFTGMSHFHIACMFCPDTLDIVKDYLNQSFSPDTMVKRCKYDKGSLLPEYHTGLHIAGEVSSENNTTIVCCPELAHLLLEYGATVNPAGGYRMTAFEYCTNTFYFFYELINYVEYMSVLLEAGATCNIESMNAFISLIKDDPRSKITFLRSALRIILLNQDCMSHSFENYRNILRECSDFDGNTYAESCLEELKELIQFEIISDLNKMDGRKFTYKRQVSLWTKFSKMFPIYGNILKIKFGRKILDAEKKKLVAVAASYLVHLVPGNFHIPLLCAEGIMQNLNSYELGGFISKCCQKNFHSN